MNEPRDANVTSDFSPGLLGPLTGADPQATTGQIRGSAGTDASHPAGPVSARDLPAVPGYRVLREIARGGMGRVLAAFDLTLERDVALKILLPGANADRFVQESKITAQLPHPGIPPVHALGTLTDGSPFLAMKLVAGKTLAEELETPDRSRLHQVFTQVCQAVGFAHSRGVVHRDLKPANVMVGAFGEVQVMDWGLAKDLSNRGATVSAASSAEQRSPRSDARPDQTTAYSEPSATADGRTEAGSVVGTPAYMAPEQARGEALDARADVFALGALLCKILTGQPPFSGQTALEVVHQAGAADLADANARLQDCGADAELVALCRRCLSPRAVDRPADGQAVADGLTAYLDGVQQRLQTAERERAVAMAREAEQRKRRRLTLALAAMALLALTLGGGSWLWVKADRDARSAQATRDAIEAVSQAALSREQAKSAPAADVANLFAKAREQAQRAAAVVASGPVDDQLRERVRQLQAELDAEEKDQRLLAALDAAQAAQAVTLAGQNRFAQERSLPLVQQALAAYGLPVGAGEPAVTAQRIRERPPQVQAAIVAALDDWVDLAGNPAFKLNEPNLEWLRAVALAIEPQDTWTRRLRAASQEPDRAKRRAALEKLAAEPEVTKLPAAALERLANLLWLAQADAAALQVRRLAQQLHPDDFKANQQLAASLRVLKPPQHVQAIRYLTAAVALRPDSAGARLNLGQVLLEKGDADEAIVCFRQAIELDPKYTNAHNTLGSALRAQGKLDEAIATYKTAIALDPKDFAAYYNLGNLLKQAGDAYAAIASYREAIARNPKFAHAHVNLGLELANLGQLDEAIACYQKALQHAPNFMPAYLNLGVALARQGQEEAAIASYRKALEIDPQQPMAHGALGQTLLKVGRYAEARAAASQALALLPEKHPMRGMANTILEDSDRFLKLQERLPRFFRGEDKVSTAQEGLDVAQLCRQKQHHAAAVRFAAAAFAADPELAADLEARHRFSAACSAALAAAGNGEDTASLDDAAKAKLRLQALVWLKADLATCAKLLDSNPSQARPLIVQTLSQWQEDGDLASLRNPAALAKLPPDEQKAFTQLLADGTAMLKKAGAGAENQK